MRTGMRITGGATALALMMSATVVATPALASTAVERFDAMALTPMPDDMAKAQRGAGLEAWAIQAAVTAVAKFYGTLVGNDVNMFLQRASIPTTAEYQKHFGTMAGLILGLFPWYAKPYIVR